MPKAARVGDKTSDGGSVTKGCDTVLIKGVPIARECDAVDTPKLGKGVIAEHSKTVIVAGRYAAFTGHCCGEGGGGGAGDGMDDVLSSFSPAREMIAEAQEKLLRQQNGLPDQPTAEMRATPQPPPQPDPPQPSCESEVEGDTTKIECGMPTQVNNIGTVSGNGATASLDSVDNLAHCDISYTGIDPSTGFATPTGENSIECVGTSVDYTGTITSPEGSFQATGGYSVGSVGADYSGGPGAGNYGVGAADGAHAEVANLHASVAGELPVTSIIASSVGMPMLGGAVKQLFPSLGDITVGATAEAKVDLLGAGADAGAKADYDPEAERGEVCVSGELADLLGLKADVCLSLGKKMKGSKAIQPPKKKDVKLEPADHSVHIEG